MRAIGAFSILASLALGSPSNTAIAAKNAAPGSRHAAAAPPKAAGSAIAFARWTEPREKSFTIDVPKGWEINGGLNWTGPIDPQMFVSAKSADGTMQVFIGDPDILPRQVPGGWTRMQTGVGEGGVFRTPSGGRALVQRFLDGVQFAKAHVSQRVCQRPQWLRAAPLPDAAREATTALASEARAYNVVFSASAGETGFDCGGALGYTASTTVLVQSPASPMQFWAVLSVSGFLATDPARAIEARYVMEHMVATMKKDPAWVQAWEQRVRQVTGAVISMQNATTAEHLRAARNASDALARLNHPNPGVSHPGGRRDSNVNSVLGTRHVCDAIGRCDTVSDDHESVFIDHSGRIAAGRAGGAPPDNSGVWSEMR
jgi:hypothetical protein